MPASLRVLVVDDDEPFRRLLATIVAEAGHELVGEAADGDEAIGLAAELDPDVITVDLEMPRMDGAVATGEIRSGSTNAEIVIVSGSHSTDLLDAALAAGAREHVAKRDVSTRLPAVLGAIASETLARRG